MNTKENLRPFYIDIDKSSGNWRYLLRGHLPGCHQAIGCQVAEFNAYFFVSRPGLMEKITDALNDTFEEEYSINENTY